MKVEQFSEVEMALLAEAVVLAWEAYRKDPSWVGHRHQELVFKRLLHKFEPHRHKHVEQYILEFLRLLPKKPTAVVYSEVFWGRLLALFPLPQAIRVYIRHVADPEIKAMVPEHHCRMAKHVASLPYVDLSEAELLQLIDDDRTSRSESHKNVS